MFSSLKANVQHKMGQICMILATGLVFALLCTLYIKDLQDQLDSPLLLGSDGRHQGPVAISKMYIQRISLHYLASLTLALAIRLNDHTT